MQMHLILEEKKAHEKDHLVGKQFTDKRRSFLRNLFKRIMKDFLCNSTYKHNLIYCAVIFYVRLIILTIFKS
jgi:hypothetical protein